MKLFKKKLLVILIIFFKTGNLLSDNNLFNVNNILIEKKEKETNQQITNRAIKKGFEQLIDRILLKEDKQLLSTLNFTRIKDLVKYYNISKNFELSDNSVNFNITFDKYKIHNLFYEKEIYYSDIKDKEFYVLPILMEDNEIFVFSNNYFYKNWNQDTTDKSLIDFILLIENIETIQIVNRLKDNLLDLNLKRIFKEYQDKNKALILIENKDLDSQRVYLRAHIQNKTISKNFLIKKEKLDQKKFKEKTILTIKDEIINLVKIQNLIDIRAPSFLNVKFNLNKKNNLVLLNSKIKNIELIENIFIQEFNKNYVSIKIKYLGKLDKLLEILSKESINLELINDKWIISILK